MALPGYVQQAIKKKSGLPDYVRAAIESGPDLREPGPIIPGQSTSVLTGKPVSEGEMLIQNSGLESGGELVSNIPASAVNLGKDIFQAVRHPVQTAKGIGGLVAGTAEKLIPGEQPQERYADAFGKMVIDRYGSIDKFKETVVQDPVGALVDISSLVMAGGGALKAAGAATKTAKVASAGEKIMQAGRAVESINIIKKGLVKPITRAIPKELPRKMYESAAKFSTVLPEKQRAQMSRTALTSGILPNGKGIDKARGMIESLNDEITAMIDRSTKTGTKIKADNLFKYLDDIRKEVLLSDDPVSHARAINKIEKSIKTGVKIAGGDSLSPMQAQSLKQQIYKAVNYENRPRSPKAIETAKKSVARAAKDELESIHPELKNLNAKEGELIQLVEALQRSANRISNRDLLGIGIPIKGTAGGVVGGGAGAVAGIVGGILDTPIVKARLAIALEKIRKAKLANKTGTTAARNITALSGRGQ
jgi:hypothetical protein